MRGTGAGGAKRRLRGALVGLGVLLGGFLAPLAPASAQTTQCIANVAAQGSSDAITSAQLPCGTTTNLVILTAAAANTTTIPTYAPVGSVPLPITLPGGVPLSPGDIAGAGYQVLLTSTGTSWVLLNPKLSTLAPGSAALNGALPHVASLTALKAYPTSYGNSVYRDGYYVAGDGGGETYTYSAVPCGIGGGNGDNGSQVKASDGGCWTNDIRKPQNIRVYGAKGDGATDDYVAIQSATNAVSSGGVVFFPQGYYCDKTGPIATSQQGVSFVGENPQFTSVLSACEADISLVNINGQHDTVRLLALLGSNIITTTHAVVNAGTGCVECVIDENYIEFGNECVNASSGNPGSEVYVRWNKCQYQYGFASLYFFNTGGNAFRNKLDQPWPAGTPASQSVAFASWAGTTLYARGAVVKDGNYVIQATVTGTSGSGLPTVLPYGQSISDGTVTWQLAGIVGSSAIQCDTGCGAVLDISYNDMSSTYYYGISMTNGFGGTVPSLVMSGHNTFGSLGVSGVNLVAGLGFQSETDTIGGLVYTGSSGVNIGVGFQGDASFNGDQVCGANTGFLIGGGAHTTISGGNVVGGAATAVSVLAGVSGFNVTNNQLGSSTRCGNNTTGVFVATGSSDYYTVVGNSFNGATTGVSDGGTGTHKTVTPNP